MSGCVTRCVAVHVRPKVCRTHGEPGLTIPVPVPVRCPCREKLQTKMKTLGLVLRNVVVQVPIITKRLYKIMVQACVVLHASSVASQRTPVGLDAVLGWGLHRACFVVFPLSRHAPPPLQAGVAPGVEIAAQTQQGEPGLSPTINSSSCVVSNCQCRPHSNGWCFVHWIQ